MEARANEQTNEPARTSNRPRFGMGPLPNPYEASDGARMSQLLLAFYMLLFLAKAIDSWFSLVVLGVGLTCIVWWFRTARVAMRPIRRLAKQLPWFDEYPVTCRALTADQVFDDELRNAGFERIELAGAQIDGWDALVDALEQHVEPRRWPSDARKKVMALLSDLARDRRRHCALVWRDAAASGSQHPSLVASFVADWSAMATHLRPGLLVFIDLPDVAAHEQEEAA